MYTSFGDRDALISKEMIQLGPKLCVCATLKKNRNSALLNCQSRDDFD